MDTRSEKVGVGGDKFAVILPYCQTNPQYHLHLNIGGYDCISYGIFEKINEFFQGERL